MKKTTKYFLVLLPPVLAVAVTIVFNPTLLKGSEGWTQAVLLGLVYGVFAGGLLRTLDD